MDNPDGCLSDPFAPLAADTALQVVDAGSPEDTKEEIWEPVLRTPMASPEAWAIRRYTHGLAFHRWIYADAARHRLFAAARFDALQLDGAAKNLLRLAERAGPCGEPVMAILPPGPRTVPRVFRSVEASLVAKPRMEAAP